MLLTRHAWLRESVIGTPAGKRVGGRGSHRRSETDFESESKGPPCATPNHVVLRQVTRSEVVLTGQRYRLPASPICPHSELRSDVPPVPKLQTPTDWNSAGWVPPMRTLFRSSSIVRAKKISRHLCKGRVDRFRSPKAGKRKLVIAGGGPTAPGVRAKDGDGAGRSCAGFLPGKPGRRTASRPLPIVGTAESLRGMPNVVLEAIGGCKPVVLQSFERQLELIAAKIPDQGFDPATSPS